MRTRTVRKARGPEKNQAWYGGNNEGPGRDSEKKVLLACWRLLVCQEQRGAVALGPQSLPHPYNGLSKCQGWGSLVQLPHCTAGPRLHVLHLHGETRTNAGRTNSSYTLWALSVLFPAPQGTLPLPQPSSHKSDFIPNPKGQGGLQEMAHEISIFVSLALESSSYSTGDLALHMHSMLLLNPLEHHICLKYIFFLARAHTISFCCVLPRNWFYTYCSGDTIWIQRSAILTPLASGAIQFQPEQSLCVPASVLQDFQTNGGMMWGQQQPKSTGRGKDA